MSVAFSLEFETDCPVLCRDDKLERSALDNLKEENHVCAPYRAPVSSANNGWTVLIISFMVRSQQGIIK